MTEVKMSAEVTDENGTIHKISLESLHERVTNLENVTITNGKTRKIPINEVVSEIWSDIELIRDSNKIWRIIKKYKKTVGFVILAIASYFKWQDIIWVFKELF